ncbi:putative preQ0 transporter [Moritella sp. JT01]|uniref:queuosine precursor transporter n=1 Tax=Moritella sp. JT01 TaxID=756698 RepID=UPI0007934283|nr:queuosine precursor transporter [Moritella sp. JT01]KXO06648.1 putative preQ0 transporter [Moritella sp. JT01]
MNRYNRKYKLIGFTYTIDTTDVKANIMVLSTGKIVTISCEKLEKNDMSDDLNRHELNQIHKKIYSHTSTVTSYDIKDRKESYWLLYTILSLLLTVVFICSSITGIKPVEFTSINVIMPAALLIYPFTFILIDTLNEFYGIHLARISIILTLLMNTLFFSALWLLSLTPSMTGWELDQSFTEMVTRMFAVLLASSVSYFLSENINSYFLQKIKSITNNRYLFIRVIFSTVIAAAIDSVLFIMIAFYGVFDMDVLKVMIITQFVIKVIYSIIGVFPIYLSRYAFKKIIN